MPLNICAWAVMGADHGSGNFNTAGNTVLKALFMPAKQLQNRLYIYQLDR